MTDHTARLRRGRAGESNDAVRDGGTVQIYGFHAVSAVLRNPARLVRRLALTENAERRFVELHGALTRKHERVQPRDLDRILGADTVHQGVLAETEPLVEPTLEELAARAMLGGPLVVLDQVTDPHNVGAILRSAAVFGSSGLIMTRRNSPPLGGALAKSASGALEHVPVTLVTNLAQALAGLAEQGLHRVGLDGEASDQLGAADFATPAAIVLGAEGKGLRRLTRELCDRLVRIGGTGPLVSLNVSNAATIALFAASLSRGR